MKRLWTIFTLFNLVFSQDDTTPPLIQSLTFSPDTINTTNSSQTVATTIRITDDLSGLALLGIEFESSSGQIVSSYMNLSSISPSVTDTILVFETNFDQYSEAGDWVIDKVYLSDQVGNSIYQTTSMLTDSGFATLLVNDENADPSYAISLITRPATLIAHSSAYLNGYVSAFGGSHQLFFQYGENDNVSESEIDVGVTLSGITSAFNAGIGVEGLTPSTDYSFRLIAKSLSGNIQELGNTLTFSTPANSPPIITSIDNISINEDSTLTVLLSGTDPDGDIITYSGSSDTNSVSVSISADTLSLTSSLNWNGSANISVYASDGTAADTTTFTLTVIPVNDAPVLASIGAQSTNEATLI